MKPIERLRKFGTSSQHVKAGVTPSVARDGPVLLAADKGDVLGRGLCVDHHFYPVFLLAMAFHPDAPEWLKEYSRQFIEVGGSLLRPWDMSRFMEYVTSYRGIGRSVRRFVSIWYQSFGAALRTDLVKEDDRRWLHRDIIRMCHVRGTDDRDKWLFGYIVGKADFESPDADTVLHVLHIVKNQTQPIEILKELVRRYRISRSVWPEDLKNDETLIARREPEQLYDMFKAGLKHLKPREIGEFLSARGGLSPYVPLSLVDYFRLLVLAGLRSRAHAVALEGLRSDIIKGWLAYNRGSSPYRPKKVAAVCRLGIGKGLSYGLPNISKTVVADLVTAEATVGKAICAQELKGPGRAANLVITDSLSDALLRAVENSRIETAILTLGKGELSRDLPVNVTEVHGYSTSLHGLLGDVGGLAEGYAIKEVKPRRPRRKVVSNW
jgi:hypothetical protein